MYSLNSNSRRITSFVQEEAYKWLYARIIKNEYDASANRQAQKLILDIKKAGRVTEDTYKKFTALVLYNPFDCIIRKKKNYAKKFIVTETIENFFVKYNNVVLPIGFIKDFFEDDYETQAEIDRYIESIVKGQEELFTIKCQEKILHKTTQVSDLKLANPCVFNTKFSFHFTNVFRIILTLLTLIVCLHFVVGEDLVRNGIDFFKSGAYETFFEDYQLKLYHVQVVLNVLVLLFLIPRVIKAIKTVIFYVIWLTIRLRVFFVSASINKFESSNFEALREYFRTVQPEIIQTHRITEEMGKGAPSAKKQYLAIVDFDCDKITETVRKIFTSKHFSFLNAYYTDDTTDIGMSILKKRWRKKLVFHTLLLLVLCCLNVAFVNEYVMSLYELIRDKIAG